MALSKNNLCIKQIYSSSLSYICIARAVSFFINLHFQFYIPYRMVFLKLSQSYELLTHYTITGPWIIGCESGSVNSGSLVTWLDRNPVTIATTTIWEIYCRESDVMGIIGISTLDILQPVSLLSGLGIVSLWRMIYMPYAPFRWLKKHMGLLGLAFHHHILWGMWKKTHTRGRMKKVIFKYYKVSCTTAQISYVDNGLQPLINTISASLKM